MKPWINEDIFKSWTEAQKRLWDSLCSAVPFQPPAGVEAWRETYLKNLATWEAAVRQTLSKEAAWVRRWVEQVAREKGAPELMTTWVRQMEEVLQRWVQTQNQWWDEYFAVLRRGSGFIAGSKQTVAESVPAAEPASVAEPSPVAEPVPAMEPTPVAELVSIAEPSPVAELVPIAEPASTAAAEPAVTVMESAAVTETSRPLAADEIAVEPAPTPPATEAVVEAATVPVVTSDSPSGDDLRLITGIGPALERKLRDLGICNYRQLATLGDEEIDRLETAIKAAGRIRRDDWIGQAKARHLQKYQEQL